jgi:hypothetical protein
LLENIFGQNSHSDDEESAVDDTLPTPQTDTKAKAETKVKIRAAKADPKQTSPQKGALAMENPDNIFSEALADLKREAHFLYQSIVSLSDHHAEVNGNPAAARDCRDCALFRVGWHVPCVTGVDPYERFYQAVRCPSFEEVSEAQKLINRDEAAFEHAIHQARFAQK